MDIELQNVGKRYIRRWVFKDISRVISGGARLGVTGHNGSGKSTLLRIITGALPASSGAIRYIDSSSEISLDTVYKRFAFAAPYSDLIEEMTISEVLKFHGSFRTMRSGVNESRFIQLLGDQFFGKMHLKSMSSGMKQRMRVALAVLTESEVLVLDEPTSNLDEQGKQWFKEILLHVEDSTTVIIASNEASDMETCQEFIHIPDYLPSRSVSM